MSQLPTPPSPAPQPRPTLWRTLRAGAAVSVLVLVAAVFAVEATPHVRGVGFQPALRLAVLGPWTIAATLTAALAYSWLKRRTAQPRAKWWIGLAGATAIAFGGLTVSAGGLVHASWLALLGSVLLIGWLVPRFVDHPRRSRVMTTGLVFLGALELAGILGAWRSEGGRPASPQTLAAEIPRTLFDADHKFIDLPGGARVHYVDEGRGETLLFLHGNPAWSFQWRDLIRSLRDTYRCVALDYPGFGLSLAPAGFGFTPAEESRVVEEFVDRLGLRDVTLVMQDWGGPIGLALAGRRPELVRRIILGNTWAWPTPTSEPRGQFSVIAGGPIGEFIQVNFNGFAYLGIAHGVVHPAPASVTEWYVRPFRPIAHRGIAAFYPGQITAAAPFFSEVEAGLPRLSRKPALIFWGRKDVGFPLTDLQRFQTAFPLNRTVEFPDADHFFFEDEAPAMVPAIRQFMADHKP